MYNSGLENKLIVVDIVNVMQDYCSIQIDIDETKVKAACNVAQEIDLKKTLKSTNLNRCINPETEADEALKELVIPPLCYYTYARCLSMFPGTFTDSGYTTETEAEDKNVAKSVSNEMHSIAGSFMEAVIEFLEEEDPNTESNDDELSPNINVFGGEEIRASN